MKPALVVTMAFLGFARAAGAHAGNNDSNSVHACVGNLSKIVRIVGVGGSCIAAPPLVAETPMHWLIDATQSGARITALEGQVAALQTLVASLQTAISSEGIARASADSALHARIDGLGGGGVPQSLLDLAEFVSVDRNAINGLAGPHVIFTGANVHIRSGLGATNGNPASPTILDPGTMFTNGLGNLVVGYNEGNPIFTTRTGSHNLVVGVGHSYTSFGGVVFGRSGNVSGPHSSVLGGESNVASGYFATISGGDHNLASGHSAAVSGGAQNSAYSTYGTVSGGGFNIANGTYATVSGGSSNSASGLAATVSGGNAQSAASDFSVVP